VSPYIRGHWLTALRTSIQRGAQIVSAAATVALTYATQGLTEQRNVTNGKEERYDGEYAGQQPASDVHDIAGHIRSEATGNAKTV
jgi:hypothetical protein